MEEHKVAIMDDADLVVCSSLDFCTSLLFMVDISKLLKILGSLFLLFSDRALLADFSFIPCQSF